MRLLNNLFSGLGLVPNGKRTVSPIPAHLLALVPKPEGKNEVVKAASADPERDTVPMLMRNVRRQKWQGAKLAKALKGSTRYQTVKNIYDFIFDHIQYELDPQGSETVRSIRRLIADKKGDCDCFASAIANLLLNLNIPFAFRIAAYKGSEDYSHIYIIVPKSGNSLSNGYYTIDPVVHQFNYEVPFTSKKDFGMELKSLDGFAGLGSCYSQSALTAQQKQVNTLGDMVPLSWLKRNGLVSSEKFLTDAGLPFELKEQPDKKFMVAVSTPNGEQLLPTIITPDQAATIKNYLQNPPPPSAIASKTVKPKSNWLKWLLGIGISVVVIKTFSTNKKEKLAGIGGMPRKKVLSYQF